MIKIRLISINGHKIFGNTTFVRYSICISDYHSFARTCAIESVFYESNKVYKFINKWLG